MFLAEGDLVVERALAAGCRPFAALIDASRPPRVAERIVGHAPVYAGGPDVRLMVTQLGVPSDIVALFHRPPRPSLDELVEGGTRLVLVEAVDNPANIGAIVRNAAGLGWDGLVLDRSSADPLARRALRVSMGHGVAFPHARAEDAALAAGALRDWGWTVVALAVDGSIDLGSVDPAERMVLAVGAERTGLSDGVVAASTHRVRIPMAEGVDSLNVAAATAIACYALAPR